MRGVAEGSLGVGKLRFGINPTSKSRGERASRNGRKEFLGTVTSHTQIVLINALEFWTHSPPCSRPGHQPRVRKTHSKLAYRTRDLVMVVHEPQVRIHLPAHGNLFFRFPPDPSITPEQSPSELAQLVGQIEARLPPDSGRRKCRGVRLVWRSWCALDMRDGKGAQSCVYDEKILLEDLREILIDEGSWRWVCLIPTRPPVLPFAESRRLSSLPRVQTLGGLQHPQIRLCPAFSYIPTRSHRRFESKLPSLTSPLCSSHWSPPPLEKPNSVVLEGSPRARTVPSE